MTGALAEGPGEANLASTRILDHEHPGVRSLVVQLGQGRPSPRVFVQTAHAYLQEKMNAVYSIEEDRPVSETLRLNEGSCAQRMAAVEALARGYGVATRVRVLWLDRRFWFSRLPLLRFSLPERTLMPWPQFYADARWVDFDEVFGSIEYLAAHSSMRHAFTNRGESLFDAVRHAPVDLLGKLRGTAYASYDISAFVIGNEGVYDTRDEALAKFERKPGWLGRLIFNSLYGGRQIRRVADD